LTINQKYCIIKFMYINISKIKKLAKEKNKQVSKSFLMELNRIVFELVNMTLNTHNGGKKRIDGQLLLLLTKNKY